MNAFLIINILAIAFCKQSSAFINGFPKEQCDDMDPTKIKLENAGSNQPAFDADSSNSTDSVTEEAPPTSVQPSVSINLFRIVTSAPKYRRGRTLNITIRGPPFNAVILQVRKIGADERRGFDQIVRVGEFVGMNSSMKTLMCDKNQATAVTNKNYALKNKIVLQWKAPKEDVGDVQAVARFIVGEDYFPITESREISINEFPVNLKNCGKAKSCILYSEKSASCHEDNCDYILTYSVVNSTNVEFVLGGSSKGEENNYLAVGFSPSAEAEKMKIIACTRAKTVAEIKFYTHESMEDGLMEQPAHLDNKKMDLDGDRMWCSFVVPMVSHLEGDDMLDLSVPLYQIYMRGSTNYTKSSNHPILPSKLLISKTEVQVEKIKLQYHTMEKPKQNSDGTVLSPFFALVTLLATIQLWENVKRFL